MLAGQVLIDPSAQPTEVLMSWKGDGLHLLPAGSTVCIDGPGTCGKCHDEVIWLSPAVEPSSFVCSFRLELHVEPQPGNPRDVGRHGGVALGVSTPFTDGQWPTPRASMEDGAWLGWWPEGYYGKAFGEDIPWLVKPRLRQQPEDWVIKAEGNHLAVRIGGVLVCDFSLKRPLHGFIGFWRARSEHMLTAHDLCVKIKGLLVLTLVTSICESNEAESNILAVDCMNMAGESILSFSIGKQQGVAELFETIMEGLGRPYSELRLLRPDGCELDNRTAVLSEALLV